MTITEFLEARFSEDEAVARAAAKRSADWPHGGTWWLEGVEHEVVGDEEAFCHPHNADHIARHDPARVLAECAAKRAIVGFHAPVRDVGWKSGEANDYLWCGSCGSLDDSPVPFPCDTLKALAAVYADHPDYRQEWAL